MAVFIPCLNVDKPDSGGGFSVGVGPASTGGESPQAAVGVSFTHSDSPVTLTISPLPPFIFFGPNFAFWADLFGLGETRIDREKQQIQDVLTGIFQYLKYAYDVPIRDGHALQFGSEGVRAQFARRPEIAALAPLGLESAPILAQRVFVDDTPTLGQQQRIINQFLANAAINDWPVSTTANIWNGMVDAARDGCSDDPARWIKNPYVVLRAAEMALAVKYIGLPVLTNMATYHAIGDAIAERLVLQWANNPELVSQLTYEDKYSWQGIYKRNEWALAPYRYPLGGTIPLYSRDHFISLVSGVQVLRPRYPDFQGQPPGGIQPSPPSVPQPPTPPPTPQPSPTPTPQPEPPLPTPQPPTVEIPTQEQYQRACDIMRRMTRREGMSQADLDWMLTEVGARAMAWAANQPQCVDVPPGQQPLPPDVTQPDCPVDPQPGPSPTPQPTPVPRPAPRPQPYPDPQDPNRPCPPACQADIDRLRDQLLACCSRLDTWAIPNILEIWRWLTDVERRLPGPPPVLIPAPPRGPVPPPVLEPPPDEPPGENPPGEVPPPLLPPEVIECVKELCDPQKLCEKIRGCERELECVEVPLCDASGGPWGGMAECWLSKNTPSPDDVQGIFAARSYPSYAVDQMAFAFSRTFADVVGRQSQLGGLAPTASDQSELAQTWRFSSPIVNKLTAAFRGTDYQAEGAEDIPIEQRDWIFADPNVPTSEKVRYRSVKLRDGEIDPCTGVTQGTLEIPPLGGQS